MNQPGNLTGKTALVTGAARGIGKAIALDLAERGATVAFTDLDEEAAPDARDLGGSARHLTRRLDVADRAALAGKVERIARDLGGLDIVVNNAGVTCQIDFFELDAAEVDRIVDINLKGTLAMMQAAAAIMRDSGGGRIVNIASIAGKGYRHTSNIAYAASKGAIITMTRIAAAQLGRHGITVNAVCPGITETELMGAWLEDRAAVSGISPEKLGRDLLSGSALGRMNTAGDIAGAVAYFVSDDARNVTGQSLNVDAGTMWD